MPNRLTDIDVNVVADVDAAANRRKHLIVKAATAKASKTEGGQEYEADDFAYMPDAMKPDEWKLRMTEYVDGKKQMTAAQVGRAIAAMEGMEMPDEHMDEVKSKLRTAWKKMHPDKTMDDMPEHIAKADEATLKERLWSMFKAAFGKKMGDGKSYDEMMEAQEHQRAADEAMSGLWDMHYALQDSVRSIIGDETVADKKAAITESVAQFQQAMMEHMDNMSMMMAKVGRKISGDRLKRFRAMYEELGKIIAEAESDGIQKGSEQPVTVEEVLKTLPEDQRKLVQDELAKSAQVETLTKRAEEAEAKLVEIEKGEPKNEPEDIWKGVHPEVRKQFEDAQKRAAKAEEIAKAEKEKREWADLVKRAEAYENVGGAEDIANLLKGAYVQGKEYAEKLEATLKAANERIAKGDLFAEKGTSAPSEDSAEGQLEMLAKKRQAESAGLSYEQAYDDVMRANPELYKRALQEVK